MIKPVTLMFGTDPEGFFEQNGKIIGSEKVIPRGGLLGRSVKPAVVLDGVQFEMNPPARNGINLLGTEISGAFELLSRQLRKVDGVKLCWKGLVDVDRAELDSLSKETRILGCEPSKNAYGDRPITIDGATYTKRSAGGHLHFGLSPFLWARREPNFVPVLDIIVGNTCVLLDRDPGAAERRENYGRAGEYRLPKYGLEYRTLSNFWVRNYSLMHFVFGMAQLAASIVQDGLLNDLAKVVDVDKIVRAIDTNDWSLAMGNFENVCGFLSKNLPERGFPLNPNNINSFLDFCETVYTTGIERFFPEDPMTHWLSQNRLEFQNFLEKVDQ